MARYRSYSLGFKRDAAQHYLFGRAATSALAPRLAQTLHSTAAIHNHLGTMSRPLGGRERQRPGRGVRFQQAFKISCGLRMFGVSTSWTHWGS